MTQYQAVIETLERLGGIATLAKLYQEVFKIEECQWKTKTPFASIRQIVQIRPEIFKVRPGLWALESHRQQLESIGAIPSEARGTKAEDTLFTHSYYQGLLVEIGKMKQLGTFVPAQDRNKMCANHRLGDMISVAKMPQFTYPELVSRSSTIDVIWFDNCPLADEAIMPNAFFEVEHSTDIQNSLLKYLDLNWFNTKMFIVADDKRHDEFDKKMRYSAFEAFKKDKRVEFLSYASLLKLYDHLSEETKLNLAI